MNMNRAVRVTYFLLRVVTGSLFFQAGSVILFGWFGGMPGQPGSSPPLMSQLGIGGGLEFFGGLAIVLGLLTRPIAFILSGESPAPATDCSSRAATFAGARSREYSSPLTAPLGAA